MSITKNKYAAIGNPHIRILHKDNLIYLDKKYGIVDCRGNVRTLDLCGEFYEWIFPQHPFFEYEVQDEWYCRKYNVGYEKRHYFSLLILRAECVGQTDDYIIYKDLGIIERNKGKMTLPCRPS